MLDYKQFTLQRLDSFIHQIALLNETDFPYDDSKTALSIISDYISSLRTSLNKSILSGEFLKSRCSRVNDQLGLFHRFLGYIDSSSSPTNNFEIYFSFRRIAESISGNQVKLIINSDWESYFPINHSQPEKLIDFVFLGLPVSEAENPLIVPLAGHELGHSIWRRKDIPNDEISFIDKYRILIDRSRKSKYPNEGEDIGGRVLDISLMKCEEYFCDLIGLGIFGPSYLYAFAYLLAPQISRKYSYSHPNSSNRAKLLLKASSTFGYNVPEGFEELFKVHLSTDGDYQNDELIKSEEFSFDMIDNLINDTHTILKEKDIFYQRSVKHDAMVKELLSLVPIQSADTLADITNASWEVYFISNKWDHINKTAEEKIQVLYDITTKSFELLEINQRLHDHDT